MGGKDNRFNVDSLWISRALESDVPYGFDSIWLSSVLRLTLIPNLVFLLFLYQRGHLLGLQTVFDLGMTMVGWNLAPAFAWYYDERVLPRFFSELGALVPSEQARMAMAERFEAMLKRYHWYGALFTVPFVLGGMWISFPYFQEFAGVRSMTDPYFLFWLAMLLYGGMFLSLALVIPVVTARAVREATTHPLALDPLHPDNVGGMNCIGELAVGATLLVSLSSVTLPISFRAAEFSRAPGYVYFYVALILGAILVAFLYPTFYGYFKAKDRKTELLNEKVQRYRRIREGFKEVTGPTEAPGDHHEVISDLETKGSVSDYMQLLREEIDDLRTVSVFPLDPRVVAELTSSLALPVLVLVLEYTLQSTVF